MTNEELWARAARKSKHEEDAGIMPFGSYKGMKIKELPYAYLEWAIARKGITADTDIYDKLKAEYDSRWRRATM